MRSLNVAASTKLAFLPASKILVLVISDRCRAVRESEQEARMVVLKEWPLVLQCFVGQLRQDN